ILWFMITLSVIEAAIMVTLLAITVANVESLPVISTPTGCDFEGIIPLSAVFWTPAIIVEPILCLMVLKRALGRMRGRTRLSVLLARDSLLYFIVIFAELVASTVVWAHYPYYITTLMPSVLSWSTAIPSLLGNRLLLNMRRHFDYTDLDTTRGTELELSPYPGSREARRSISKAGILSRPDMPVFSPRDDEHSLDP
ncbi:hypothetical protein HYDPIDRAFT_77106, partial [Hydnomerulius pinastri MD-312]